MKTAILFFLCAWICSDKAEGAEEWGYEAPLLVPSQWSTVYSDCGESNQSPINIDPKTAVHKATLGKIKLVGYGEEAQTWELKNNGHTMSVYPEGHQMAISGGGLPSTYKMAQTHFHWGKTGSEGSEHVINNKPYPLEMHIVSTNIAANFSADLEYDAYAVMGVFFEISDTPNAAATATLKQIQDSFVNATYKDDNFVMPASFSLETLMPADQDHFYRYNGSLTTPGCNEAVIWTVFTNTVKISAEQVDKFRQLATTARDVAPVVRINQNFRPRQTLGTRTVWSSIAVPVGTTTTPNPNGAPPMYSPMGIFAVVLALVHFC